MGRGKVQLKRIDDKIRRQVTFSKRRSGLIKKARELSVLCGVEVGLIIFSAKGRLYEFCSGESLGKVLERYQIHNDEETADPKNGSGTAKKHPSEWSSLCAGSNRSLKMSQSDMEAQNIEKLDVPELAQLEKHLDASLRQIRSRKTQLLIDTLTALTDKEKQLQEEKLLMEKEIAELKKEKESRMDGAEEEEEPDQHSSSAANTETISSDGMAPPSPKRHTMLHLF